MDGASLRSFSVAIAFLLPGYIATLGVAVHSDLVSSWLLSEEQSYATVGGVLFSTVFALGCGLIASTVRWLIIDSIQHWTGIKKQPWDYGKLQANIGAYQLLEENHYRFYQFYGNSLCALVFAYVSWRLTKLDWLRWEDPGFVVLAIVLFLGSRDTLRKYYERVSDLLNSMAP